MEAELPLVVCIESVVAALLGSTAGRFRSSSDLLLLTAVLKKSRIRVLFRGGPDALALYLPGLERSREFASNEACAALGGVCSVCANCNRLRFREGVVCFDAAACCCCCCKSVTVGGLFTGMDLRLSDCNNKVEGNDSQFHDSIPILFIKVIDVPFQEHSVRLSASYSPGRSWTQLVVRAATCLLEAILPRLEDWMN